MRVPYVVSEKEIQTLLYGIVNYGPEETYKRMLDKAMSAANSEEYGDEMFMDMHEGLLKRARELAQDEDDSDIEDIQELRTSLYQLASMLRSIAHKLRSVYDKKIKGRNMLTSRFLRLVSNNENIPKNMW